MKEKTFIATHIFAFTCIKALPTLFFCVFYRNITTARPEGACFIHAQPSERICGRGKTRFEFGITQLRPIPLTAIALISDYSQATGSCKIGAHKYFSALPSCFVTGRPSPHKANVTLGTLSLVARQAVGSAYYTLRNGTTV